MNTDAIRAAELSASSVDSYRPAALPTGPDKFLPAIACLTAEGECVFVLARPSRPLSALAAGDEADLDLFSSPGSSEGDVGPDCLRYLDRIGYRKMPGVDIEMLRILSDVESDAGVCEHCGEVHPESDLDEGEFADDDFDDDYDLEAEAEEIVELLRLAASLPIQSMITPELNAALIRLLDSGLLPEEVLVMALRTMIQEAQCATESGGQPNVTRYVEALARLPLSDSPEAD